MSQEKNFNGKTFSLQEFSRKMIDALIGMPLTRGEISKIMNEAYPYEKPNSNVVRVKRFLEDLIAFDLIYYDVESEKYVWKIKTKDHIDMLAHSRQLIPALIKIAGITEGRYTISSQETVYISMKNMEFLKSCAEDHLLTYPDISLLLKNYRGRNRAIEEMKEKFIARLKVNLSGFLAEKPMIESDSRADIMPELICEKLLYGHSLIIDTMSESLASFIEKETSEANNLFEIERIRDIQIDAAETREELEGKIRVLIFGIEAGRALSGGCMICERA